MPTAIASRLPAAGRRAARNAVLLAVVATALIAGPARAQVEEILDTPTGWNYRYGVTPATITTDINAGLRPFSIQRVSAGLTELACQIVEPVFHAQLPDVREAHCRYGWGAPPATGSRNGEFSSAPMPIHDGR